MDCVATVSWSSVGHYLNHQSATANCRVPLPSFWHFFLKDDTIVIALPTGAGNTWRCLLLLLITDFFSSSCLVSSSKIIKFHCIHCSVTDFNMTSAALLMKFMTVILALFEGYILAKICASDNLLMVLSISVYTSSLLPEFLCTDEPVVWRDGEFLLPRQTVKWHLHNCCYTVNRSRDGVLFI